jgi:pimeloyl-ACP methyl ester carboxylesterase
MRLAYWPGMGGGPGSLDEVAPILRAAGVDAFVVDPRYEERREWGLDALAAEVAATGADVYAGSSWGGAIAARAAVERAPRALVLLDGGHFGTRDYGNDPSRELAEVRRLYEEDWRWPTWDAYLEFKRGTGPRWNETIEAIAREAAEMRDGEVRFAYSVETFERIFRAYQGYDAPATLASISPETRVLVVAADLDKGRRKLARRAQKLMPHADVRLVDSGHDVVWDKGPELGHMVAEWLAA